MRRCFVLLLILFGFEATSQNIFDTNKKLGRGINLGNMFEAPSEAAWGNPYREDYFARIAALGFQHVRIPITWETDNRVLMGPPYTVNATFLNRIKSVVDQALQHDLMVIINMHHHNELFDKPRDGEARFLSQWNQIATFFKEYSENLLFEVLNEPHGNMTPAIWNTFFARALSEIRKTNPTRAVLMGVAEFGGLRGVPALEIPKDPNLILTIHYYEPFTFTHQGASWVSGSNAWLGTKWANTDIEQETIQAQFTYAKSLSASTNIPIHIGEFGAFSTADTESRIKWTSYLARWFEEQGFSWAYWEWSAGFGIFDPQKNSLQKDLTDALLKNPKPEAVLTNTATIYSSDFSTGKDGWNLSVSNGASASFENSENRALVQIHAASNTSWHVQWIKSPISLAAKKTYLVRFKARADQPVSFSSYLGMATDPWTSYSGYPILSVGTVTGTYSYSFQMGNINDSRARLVFDLGSTKAAIFFWDMEVKEVSSLQEELVLHTTKPEEELVLYPNPAASYLNFPKAFWRESCTLLDASGKQVYQGKISQNGVLHLPKLQAGKYLARVKEKTFSLIIY